MKAVGSGIVQKGTGNTSSKKNEANKAEKQPAIRFILFNNGIGKARQRSKAKWSRTARRVGGRLGKDAGVAPCYSENGKMPPTRAGRDRWRGRA